MKKTVVVFGAMILALLALFQLSKYSLMSGSLSLEILIAVIAVVFFFIGIYMNRKAQMGRADKGKKIDKRKIALLGISNREYEVLLEVAQGLSNQEIAEKLFVSESTIKTHVSSILTKLDVKRRTQAVQRAKELRIIPI